LEDRFANLSSKSDYPGVHR